MIDRLIIRTDNIHPRWLIEEYARIFRRLVWLIPINPPITIEHRTVAWIKEIDLGTLNIADIGAIFCQVIMIKVFIHLKPSITSGNQKWSGAAPIFIIRGMLIIRGV